MKCVLLILVSMFLFSFANTTFANTEGGIGSLEVSDNQDSGGIDTDSIRASAENFSFGKAIEKIEDISFHMLIVWLLIAGILFFFTVKWAMRLTILGVIGFSLIVYHEQILGMLLGLVDWIVSVGA